MLQNEKFTFAYSFSSSSCNRDYLSFRFRKAKQFKNVKVYLVDGNSYMTRPGPRIIDGIEILSEILHPEIFPKEHAQIDWRQMI